MTNYDEVDMPTEVDVIEPSDSSAIVLNLKFLLM